MQNKCAKYWPSLGENPMMFNDLYVVESTQCEEAESYRLTYLTLHNLEVCCSLCGHVCLVVGTTVVRLVSLWSPQWSHSGPSTAV